LAANAQGGTQLKEIKERKKINKRLVEEQVLPPNHYPWLVKD
jgi:hypothetical protein